MLGFRSKKAREEGAERPTVQGKPPMLLALRSSTPFIALTVGLGILVDLAGYGLVVPVIPFRLQDLGYTDIGSKTGWLVAAYAAGLIISSPPIAYIGARIQDRRPPLIFALLFMAGAISLFMETSSYTALVISRVLQGVSGTGIWTLGLALVADSVPEARIGVVMGWVMIGFSLGQLIGPPVGGALYNRLGYRAPFVFALCLIFVDLVLRLLVIEKHVALRWIEAGLVEIPDFEAPGYLSPAAKEKLAKAQGVDVTALDAPTGMQPTETVESSEKPKKEVRAVGEKEVSTWAGLLSMCTSARPLSCFLLTGMNGIILGGLLDVGLVLHVEDKYGFNSLGAGLVFLAAVVPTIFASPFAGWVADKWGAKYIAIFGVALSILAYPLMIIRGPLGLLIFFLIIVGSSLSFFLVPVTQDLSIVVGETPGLAAPYAYGTFNMCYSIGSFVGPIMAGQIIGATGIRRGWLIMCALCGAISAALLPLCVLYIGGPLAWPKRRGRAATSAEAA